MSRVSALWQRQTKIFLSLPVCLVYFALRICTLNVLLKTSGISQPQMFPEMSWGSIQLASSKLSHKMPKMGVGCGGLGLTYLMFVHCHKSYSINDN